MKPAAINIVCEDSDQCRAVFNYILRSTNRMRRGPNFEEGTCDVVCVGSHALYTLPSNGMGINTEKYPRINYNKNSDAILKILDKLGGE